MKWFYLVAAVTLTLAGPARADKHLPTLPVVAMGGDGMYAQAWLYKSSLDLREDLAASAKQGKRLVIFWEHPECLYCKPVYEINLRIPRVIAKIKKNFNVIKLNTLGERKVTDLDGTVMLERELAGKAQVRYAPTMQFLAESPQKAAGKDSRASEAFRAEGFFRPFHFYFMFHYVESKGYESEPNFQRWLGDIGRGMQAKGIRYDLWAEMLPPDLPTRY